MTTQKEWQAILRRALHMERERNDDRYARTMAAVKHQRPAYIEHKRRQVARNMSVAQTHLDGLTVLYGDLLEFEQGVKDGTITPRPRPAEIEAAAQLTLTIDKEYL